MLEDMFEKLDTNGDGQIQETELIEGFAELYGDRVMAENEIKSVFKNIDINHNKAIDFSEFLMISLQKESFLQGDMLKEAFSAFDTDRNGTITLDELERVFQLPVGSTRESHKINIAKLFKSVDSNGDGQIDFPEFAKMMESMRL